MTANYARKLAHTARVLGTTLGLLIGTATTVPRIVHEHQKTHILHVLGLEDRAAYIRGVTTGDFNRDGRQPDYRVDFADGSVEYYLHRGYTAYRAQPDILSPSTPPFYLVDSKQLVPARQIHER